MTVRSKGVDPRLNEQGLLAMLKDEGIPFTPNGARTALSMVLLGCYDRQVKRKFMAEMLDLAAMINITMSKIEAGMIMRAALAKWAPDLKPESLDADIAEWQETWKKQRRQLAEQWGLVCECPTGEDSIS